MGLQRPSLPGIGGSGPVLVSVKLGGLPVPSGLGRRRRGRRPGRGGVGEGVVRVLHSVDTRRMSSLYFFCTGVWIHCRPALPDHGRIPLT